MRKTTRCAIALTILCWHQPAHAQVQAPAGRRSGEPIGSIAEKTKGMKKIDGFFPVYWEVPALARILDEAWKKDLRYMTNQDTSANPRVDQWPTAPIRPRNCDGWRQ